MITVKTPRSNAFPTSNFPSLLGGSITSGLFTYPFTFALESAVTVNPPIGKLEKKIAEFKSVTYALEHEHTPEKMMEDLLGDMDMKIYEKVPTQFHCNCSKERVEKAVISVGKKEIQNMIDDGEPIEVNCHFCNTHYHYSVDDLKRMLNEATR